SLPPGAPPDLIHVDSNLRLDVIDLEGVYSTTAGRWSLQGALGLRHADLQQQYHASLSNAGNAAILLTPVLRDQRETTSFYGFGPTMDGRVSFRIGLGLSLYADGRASFLFGRAHQDAVHTFLGGVPESQSFSATGSQDVCVPITELEAGLGWEGRLGRR